MATHQATHTFQIGRLTEAGPRSGNEALHMSSWAGGHRAPPRGPGVYNRMCYVANSRIFARVVLCIFRQPTGGLTRRGSQPGTQGTSLQPYCFNCPKATYPNPAVCHSPARYQCKVLQAAFHWPTSYLSTTMRRTVNCSKASVPPGNGKMVPGVHLCLFSHFKLRTMNIMQTRRKWPRTASIASNLSFMMTSLAGFLE
ncbi:hypothetical protein ANANG_G00038930 [Anguilla anguilla]|uniref:Uncharacterized protein n=1 Tax=Anguilla anguilla TaxID=7936 RepID=A0A9D3MT87_ANGAN|nr:hypothetical protein ANANG_G00038930 [Anguilla anguilla]